MEARLTPTWLIGVWLIDHLSCDPFKMWPPLKIGVGGGGICLHFHRLWASVSS